MRRARTSLLTLSTLGVVCAAGTGFAIGGFNATTQTDGNDFAAAPDFLAPNVGSTTIAKNSGFSPGFINKGGSYRVYANISDSGNPASGVASVTANVGSISAGQTSVPLTAGSFSVGGVAYNYRSAVLTSDATLSDSTYAYSLTRTDNASNSNTTGGFSVTVDSVKPTAAGIQTANGGSIVGRPELNDTITFTYSEPIDPASILSTWTGAQTDVVVRINNATNDTLLVYNSANTAQLPLGSVNLGRTDYVSVNRTFGATGTKAKMTMSGNTITVVLGTQSGAGTTAAANGTMTWTPSATAFDRAGNTAATSATTESGTADKEF